MPKFTRRTALAAASVAPFFRISYAASAPRSDLETLLLREDATSLAQHLRKGDIKAADLLEAAIERAERLDPKLGFMAQQAFDHAREQLKETSKNAPFCGVPTLMKDLGIDMPGIPTANGSRFWAGNIPQRKSTLLSRYEGAGLIPFGKTTTPELGLTATTESLVHGLTRNPWDTSRTAGGSSGGAAVAVASGIVPAAQASDGGGSIRTPASCCGLFGLKPSRGRVPLGPGRTEGWMGLSTAHAITRSVRDSALLLDISSGIELGARYAAPAPQYGSFLDSTLREPGRLKIALMLSPPSSSAVDAQCLDAVTEVAKLCESLGHHVEHAAPQFDFEAVNAAMLAVLMVETRLSLNDRANAIGRDFGPDDVEPVTYWMAQEAKTVTATDYALANRTFQTMAIQAAKFFTEFDVVLSPTLAKPPVKLGKLSLSPSDFDEYVSEVTTFGPFTAWANQTGIPSMSVPLSWSHEGLPIGSMFTGPYGSEDLLFSLAAQLETARPWAQRRPPVFG